MRPGLDIRSGCTWRDRIQADGRESTLAVGPRDVAGYSGPMDEIELRIAALDMAVIELTAWLDPGAMEDASASIRAGLAADPESDERTVRLQALSLLEDGRQRFAAPAMGVKL